jgi:hypothetical protein
MSILLPSVHPNFLPSGGMEFPALWSIHLGARRGRALCKTTLVVGFSSAPLISGGSPMSTLFPLEGSEFSSHIES